MRLLASLIALVAMGIVATESWAAPPPDDDHWTARIRQDHPRLFFNAETWLAVKERALTVNAAHFERVKRYAEAPPPEPHWPNLELPAPRPGSKTPTRDWGEQLMSAAFVYRIEPSAQRLRKIKEMLRASLDYYHASYAANKCVSWSSTTRVAWIAALDWVWNDLTAGERREFGRSMLRHVDEVLHKPDILRRNNGDHTSGYYGGRNATWFAGLVLAREGIDDARAMEFLIEGHGVFRKMLSHRAKAAGDDGGASTPTLRYSVNPNPRADWDFFYSWQSATGEEIASAWPYAGLFSNYLFWNWLPGGLEFGYGDVGHTTNLIDGARLYTHLSQAMHFYGRSHPRLAALAAHMRERVAGSPAALSIVAGDAPLYMRGRADGAPPLAPRTRMLDAAYVRERAGDLFVMNHWPISPFLMTRLEEAPPARAPERLPTARHFANMGQTFMRSGSRPDDTYAMFASGGMLDGHRHYDATHFAIYKQGHLAIDTGTREGTTDNLQNYFAQTVAHNSILIKMPGEPPSRYWNGPVYGQAGGQNSRLGSKVIAFETGPHFAYVAGDATSTYSERKCKLAVRQLVFIPPDHFVVFDRVASTDANYMKRWLLHHANEPVVDGDTWRTDQDRGRLFCRTLLPADAVLEKVGGPGKEFLADGVNYPVTAGPSEVAKIIKPRMPVLAYDEVPELMGRWRMEVRPGSARSDDVFLHLIQVGGRSLKSMSDARVSTSPDAATVTFETTDASATVRFSTSGAIAGHIRLRRQGQVLVDDALTQTVMSQSGVSE